MSFEIRKDKVILGHVCHVFILICQWRQSDAIQEKKELGPEKQFSSELVFGKGCLTGDTCLSMKEKKKGKKPKVTSPFLLLGDILHGRICSS